MLPKISSYGQYDNSNYGAHTLKVDLGDIEFYYSYETIVAYADTKDHLVCCENVWTNTTGKHLNWIMPDKKSRTKSDKFQEMLKLAIERHIK